MRPPMTHTATKQVTSRNAYGDVTPTSTLSLPCHFRYVTQLVTSNGDETLNASALAWFEPDSGVVEQDILHIDGAFWKVAQVIKGRRLRDPAVQFIKTQLTRYGAIS